MMNDKHVSIVRALLARLEPGQSRPFYFAREGDRRILHVDKQDASPQRFADLRKVNAHLETVDDPLSSQAKLIVGVVSVTDEGLRFVPSIRKGATNSDLEKGLVRLKPQLRLTAWEVADGAEDEPAETPTADVAEPSGAVTNEPATSPDDPRILREQKLAKLYRAMRAVDVERADAATLDELLKRLELYSSRGGQGDIMGLVGRIGARQVVLAQLESVAASVETVRETHRALRARLEAQQQLPVEHEHVDPLLDLIADLETARDALVSQRKSLVALSA